MVFPFADADDFARRLRHSLTQLGAWRHEAALPWADPEMTLTIAKTEIGALMHWRSEAPIDMRKAVDMVVEQWETFALELKATPPQRKR